MSAYRLLTRWWTAFALVISLAMLGFAHASERFAGLSPCNLCLKQREVFWGAVVVALVAKKHGIFRPSPAMVEELEAAFYTYCRAASDPRSPGLLHLPYGPTSRRWALTDQAHDLLRAGLDPTGL